MLEEPIQHHHRVSSMRLPATPSHTSPSPSTRRRPNSLAPKDGIRRCRSASPVPPQKATQFSAERQTLIKKTWQRVPKSTFGDTLMRTLVSKMGADAFGEDPDSVARHRRHLLELIQQAVDNIVDPEEALRPWLHVLGQAHAGFKIRGRQWDTFGESLLATVAEWIGPGRSHKETIKAWMCLSTWLADRLGHASRVLPSSPLLTPRVQLLTFVAPN